MHVTTIIRKRAYQLESWGLWEELEGGYLSGCRPETEDGSDVILFQLKSISQTRLLSKLNSIGFSIN